MNCAEFWRRGFPDPRQEAVFPCQEYLAPDASPAQVRLFFQPGWEKRDVLNPRLLGWTMQAARESWEELASIGIMRPVSLIISGLPHPEGAFDDTDSKTAAMVYWNSFDADEPCPIVLHPAELETEDRLMFAHLVAHEVVHCFQVFNLPFHPESRAGQWYLEGTAVVLSSLVYPHTGAEYHDIAGFRPNQPLYEFPYGSAAFFMYVAKHSGLGLEGLLDVMGRLSTPLSDWAPEAPLTTLPEIDRLFHDFALTWLRGPLGEVDWDGQVLPLSGISDGAGGFWPRANFAEDALFEVPRITLDGKRITVAPEAGPVRAGEGRLVFDVRHFSVGYAMLTAMPGYIYRLWPQDPRSPVHYALLDADHRVLGGTPGQVSEIHPACSSKATEVAIVLTSSVRAPMVEKAFALEVDHDPHCRSGRR